MCRFHTINFTMNLQFDKSYHSNYLIIDTQNKIAELYEPYGAHGINTSIVGKIYTSYLTQLYKTEHTNIKEQIKHYIPENYKLQNET
jgi:hypothetical protein